MRARTTKFACYDVVELACDIPESGLKQGTRGTVVLVYTRPQEAYEVEFIDGNGASIAVTTAEPEQLKASQ